MSDRNESSAGVMIGIGLCDLLFLLFIGLKLCGVIDWSWWWVTAPFWGQYALVFLGIIIVAIYMVISNLVRKIFKKENKK